ncbi:MAG: nucleoside-diphosphate sugar epimerase/dehydratase [Armatimonadota bacterium]|nr:nucleoside-diphosphate sugar epimerase/dehydratase [Armatimonadota bacterium]
MATLFACALGCKDLSSSYSYSFLIQQAALLTLMRFLALCATGVYRSVWRYASIDHLSRVTFSATLGSAVFLVLSMAGLAIYPAEILVVDWLACVVLLAGSRIAFKALFHYRLIHPHSPKRVLVVGASEAGAMVAAEIKRQQNGRRLIGFVDDDSAKVGRMVQGLPVIGKSGSIPAIISRYKIDEIVVTCPSGPAARLKEIISLAGSASVSVRVFPAVDEILSGEAQLQHPGNVRPQDLLDREEASVDTDSIKSWFTGKRVLISGAGGSIGSELCRQVAGLGLSHLYMMDHDENGIFEVEQELKSSGALKCTPVVADVKDCAKLKWVFETCRPQVVFHAAAHKHVPMMELYPEEAVKTNIIGTRNIATCAVESACEKFLLISTDKAVRPSSVMGASKRAAEIVIQSLKNSGVTSFVTVRFGNVLDSRGSLLPNLRRQIAQGGPITITHPDMERYFMTIPEAVLLVLLSAARGRNGQLMILDMGQPVNILELAEKLIRLSGKAPGRDISVRFVGIRPGEKLTEELFTEAETAAAERIGQLLVSPAEAVDIDRFKKGVAELEKSLMELEPDEIRRRLQDIVPGYTPLTWTQPEQDLCHLDELEDEDALPAAA